MILKSRGLGISDGFQLRSPMSIGLAGLAATLIDSNSMLVCGGLAITGEVQARCYTYKPEDDNWIPDSTWLLATPRYGHAMFQYTNGNFSMLD